MLKNRKKNRLFEYDYTQCGYYFVTICTENRKEILGTIENKRTVLNDIGNMVNFWWQEMFKKYNNISIEEYIIMPNHIHGIINIVGADLCVRPLINSRVDLNNPINWQYDVENKGGLQYHENKKP